MQVSEVSALWEVVKGVMLTLTTAGVGWTAKTVFTLRDDVRDLKKTVGENGNGLVALAANNARRLDDIDDRHLRVDTATAIERELAEEKYGRRYRDKITDEHRTGER